MSDNIHKSFSVNDLQAILSDINPRGGRGLAEPRSHRIHIPCRRRWVGERAQIRQIIEQIVRKIYRANFLHPSGRVHMRLVGAGSPWRRQMIDAPLMLAYTSARACRLMRIRHAHVMRLRAGSGEPRFAQLSPACGLTLGAPRKIAPGESWRLCAAFQRAVEPRIRAPCRANIRRIEGAARQNRPTSPNRHGKIASNRRSNPRRTSSESAIFRPF
jgi:hypothetical protein